MKNISRENLQAHLMSAREAWNLIHRNLSSYQNEQLAVECCEFWGIPPIYGRVIARLYATLMDVTLRSTVVADERADTAMIHWDGTIILPDRRAVLSNWASLEVQSVLPHTFKELWTFRRDLMMDRVRKELAKMKRSETDTATHESEVPDIGKQIPVRGVYDPLLMMAVLVHEASHEVFGDQETMVRLVESAPDHLRGNRKAVGMILMKQIANIAADGRIHAVVNLSPVLDILLKLIYRPSMGYMQVAEESSGKQASIDDLCEAGDPNGQSDQSRDQNQDQSCQGGGQSEGRGDKTREVLNQGSSSAKFTAQAIRPKYVASVREILRSESGKEIGDSALLEEVALQWEAEGRIDPFKECVNRLKAAMAETIAGRLHDDSQDPDPTYRKIARARGLKLVPRDDDPIGFKVYAVVDSSGSMSDEEIKYCLGAIAHALGGGGVFDVAFCDTEPLAIAKDCPGSEVVSRIPSRIPRGGTQLGNAIRKYHDLFQNDLSTVSAVLMLTDGYNDDWAVQELQNKGAPLVVGVTTRGDSEPPQLKEEVIRYAAKIVTIQLSE